MIGIEALLGIGGKLIDRLIPDPAQKAEAQLKLAELAQNGQLAELAADSKDQEEITKRWQADMSSDSWLSKNIRPMALIAIFASYVLFAMMSAFGYNAKESYVQLLGQWGIIIFGAYFTSRGAEKIFESMGKK